MLVSIILVLAISIGGLALTYLFEREEPLLWRFAAGTVIGSAIFGTISFVLASFAGLNAATVAAALTLSLLPVGLLIRGQKRKNLELDWARAKGKLQGASSIKVIRAVYYAGFLTLFCLFFSQTMYETADGIFTGGSNNLGDLPYHLGAIFSFTDGANFPPVNPSWAGAKFSYPFISDLITACFMKLGAPLRDAMFVQNVAWAFAVLVILERFVLKVTGDRLSSKIAPAFLFFSGGLGFIWFFGDLGAQSRGLVEFLGQLPKDYTIGDEFRWGNALVTLFITQRSLLLGMPLTLIVLGGLWRIFTTETQRHREEEEVGRDFADVLPQLILGLIAGLLPLVHLHSLAVLFVVTGVLFFLRLHKWREWISFGVGVAVVAIPQLVWSLTGSATETAKFFEWHFGWDSRDVNFVWFWVKNTGIFIPLVLIGVYLTYFPQGRRDDESKKAKVKRQNEAAAETEAGHEGSGRSYQLLLFYVPFVLLFVISNIAKLAPWEWDNIKVLIYWWVGSIPFVAFAISWLWRKGMGLKVAAGLCFAVLIFSGSLDVLRTASGAVKMRVFDSDAVKIADRIKKTVPAKTMFLNSPTYNSAIVLTGRQSVMRYPGHLASHGIDYGTRENDVKMIYSGGPQAEALLQKYGIEYVLVSPEERSAMRANEMFFSKFPVYAEVGQYKVYKIK